MGVLADCLRRSGPAEKTVRMEETAAAEMTERSLSDRYSSWVVEALDELPDNFLITDPTIPGHPVVFASCGFLKMSGYPRDEVVGRNAKIFQGRATCRRAIAEVREGIRTEATVEVSLLNYRKDGTPIWIFFRLSPVFGQDDGQVTHFLGVQVPIAGRPRRQNGNLGGVLVSGSCRRELCLDFGGLELDSYVDTDNGGLESEESRAASELEKQSAAATVGNVLSTLTRYSEVTGKPVCGKRCSSTRSVALGSALHISLGRIQQSFVLTDTNLPDMPIVYASDAFLSLTGYSRHEVLGHNCRFLCGPGTDIETSCQIRECIQASKPCAVRILNYRKDRSSFWNLLHISPVRNASGKIAYYVGVQIDQNSNDDEQGLMSPRMKQLSVVGTVKVAVRGLTMGAGPSSS